MSKKAKGIIGVTAAVLAIVAAVILIVQFTSGANVYEVGETVRFGKWDWRVLDVQDSKALLIAKNIIEQQPYNDEFATVTWEDCTLRKHLNSEFLKKFSEEEQARICETENINLDNQWNGTKGGNNTKDKVFLLSIEEVVKYFGDSGQLEKKNPNSVHWIDDQYDSERAAKFNTGSFWWWLRSPGTNPACPAFVSPDGYIDLTGSSIDFRGGLRPALWLKID